MKESKVDAIRISLTITQVCKMHKGKLTDFVIYPESSSSIKSNAFHPEVKERMEFVSRRCKENKN
jgi:hypothetical protein